MKSDLHDITDRSGELLDVIHDLAQCVKWRDATDDQLDDLRQRAGRLETTSADCVRRNIMNEVFKIMARLNLQLHVLEHPNHTEYVFYQEDVFGPSFRCGDPTDLIEAADHFESPDEVRGAYDGANMGARFSLGNRVVLVPDREHYRPEIRDAGSALHTMREDGVSKGAEAAAHFETIFGAMKE